jgi:LuxR family maltose regulon positive regulatory protein
MKRWLAGNIYKLVIHLEKQGLLLEQILTTKLFIPPLCSELVSRPRLIDGMKGIENRKLLLISAPAGFGKTTLVSEWIGSSGSPVAWISLDAGDSDPLRFLTYLISALQTILPGVGENIKRMLRSPQPLAPDLLLSNLINEIVKTSENIFLVLDDFHVIEDPQVDRALTFLIENLPPNLHLIITTREDPQLPLARLRAHNQLAELREADLRFSSAEAASFLNEIMDLDLSEAQIAALESRTEGWIAGLQLAGLSMQGHHDKNGFIESFTGSHQFIMDYLLEEVLENQPEHVQDFLLKTSILDHLSGSLCDAVLADPSISGQETLEYLAQANLFLIPLDHTRQWYRYHHLFADLLHQRLQEKWGSSQGKKGNLISELHLRASYWFEENGLVLKAFDHAVKANDIDRAECLMEGNGMPLQYRGIVAPILNWLKSLSEETMNARPSLRVAYASTLTMLGKPVDNIEEILGNVEVDLESSEQDEISRDYIGQIAVIRAMLAIPRNQVDEILKQSNRALTYLHPDNLPLRTNAAWSLGYAFQLRGERSAAKEELKKALSISKASGNIMMSVATLTNLGQLYELENQLGLARDSYKQVLKLICKPPLPYACGALIGLAQISYEQNKLDPAERYARQSLELAQQLKNLDTPILCHLLFARLNVSRGDIAGAGEAIRSAEQYAMQHEISHRFPDIADAKAKFYIQQGMIEKAVEVIKNFELPLVDARISLAKGDAAEALAVLEPIHEEMREKSWVAEMFKVILLKARAYHMLGDKNHAEESLEDALVLARPGKLIRSFIDEGPQIAEILSSATVKPELLDYRETLLHVYDSVLNDSQTFQTDKAQSLIEPLSKREREILHLISLGYTNREIGERLFLALNTIKGYNRNLFQKLDAKNRTEAVANARKLGML